MLNIKGWCSCTSDEVEVIVEVTGERADAVRWADAFIATHMLHDGFRFEVTRLDEPSEVAERKGIPHQ